VRVLGIDPGLNGAWALYSGPGDVVIGDLPTVGEKTKREVSGALLAALIPGNLDLAVLELVHARPGNGVSSMFRFGEASGVCKGVLGATGVKWRTVTPQAWKAFHGLRGSEGEDSRKLALQLVPKAAQYLARKMDHNRAEALLIALYGFIALA
jgi:crossover junction endodeoxyribonuclease RuvC